LQSPVFTGLSSFLGFALVSPFRILWKGKSMSAANLKDSPTAWFALLESAKRAGDADLERKAIAELARLGIRVAFDKPLGRTRSAKG
jgi:hypothetical protein